MSFKTIRQSSQLARALARTTDRDLNRASFRKLLVNDINYIASGRYEELSNDTTVYGHYWTDFQDALKSCGCEYWADIYTSLWERRFKTDRETLEHHLQLPRAYFKEGAATAAEYLIAAKRVGTKTLREARMLILGDAGSGKTSFARRFINIDAELPTDADSTRGVDIDYNNHKPLSLKESFPDLNLEHDVNLHIWDFAGQTEVHPIHSLFLSENCIYVLVYNGRIEAGNNLRYWLEKIRQFGKKSKIFILVNLYDAHTFDKTFSTEKREFADNNIKVIKASIAYDKWKNPEDRVEQKRVFNDIRKVVAQNIAEQQKPLAAHVVRIKEYLDEQFNGNRTYITFDEFAAETTKIMEKEFPNELRDYESISNFLTGFLHTLGIALYYKELQGFEMIVLNPMWIASAVYEVVANLKKNGMSRITHSELKIILTNSERKAGNYTYTDTDVRYIYRLLREYKLAYEYEDDTLILPLCMPEDEPTDFQPPFPDGETLSIQFIALKNEAVGHIPEDVIPQFIVAEHSNIYRSRSGVQLAWRKGVILKKHHALAKAIIIGDNTIRLSAVDKNGGAEYLRELKVVLENILQKISNSKNNTAVSYLLIDAAGHTTTEYMKDATVNLLAGLTKGTFPNGIDYEKTKDTYEPRRKSIMSFKIGVTFTGTHRARVLSIVNELSKHTFTKDNIFYDEWHDYLINGVDAYLELKDIYENKCDYIVVFLSKDYNIKKWTRGVEWRSMSKIINNIEGERICLLNVDDVDIDKIDGLSSVTDIAKKIDNISDSEVAEFIKKWYETKIT